MQPKADPFEVLGVGKDADEEEIRRAFRKAALKCHPDACPEDPAGAKRRFCRLVEAYRAVLRLRARAGGPAPRVHTPSDFAGSERAWRAPTAVAFETGRGVEWPGRLGMRRTTRPTLNEPAVFVCLWLAAIALAAWAGPAALRAVLPARGLGWDAPGTLACVLLALGIYAGAVAAAALGLALTRKIVWLALQLGSWRRVLPGPLKKLRR